MFPHAMTRLSFYPGRGGWGLSAGIGESKISTQDGRRRSKDADISISKVGDTMAQLNAISISIFVYGLFGGVSS